MKGKRFFSGESMKTSLVDGEGNVRAILAIIILFNYILQNSSRVFLFQDQASREITRHMVTTQHITMSDDVDSAYEVGIDALVHQVLLNGAGC